MSSNTTWHTVTIRIPFMCERHARIAKQAIEVDPELQEDVVKRTMMLEDAELVVTFQTWTIRLARLSVNGFLENVDLIIKIIGEFGEASEKSKNQEMEAGTFKS